MIYSIHLRDHIIIPTLVAMSVVDERLYSTAAVELLLGTAAKESNLGYYLKQHPTGPACGIYQIEGKESNVDTHQDLWRYLNRSDKAELRKVIVSFLSSEQYLRLERDNLPVEDSELIYNLRYASAMARIRYWMVSEPMPAAGDREAQAHYWRNHYNRNPAIDPVKYIKSYEEFIDAAL